MRSGSRQAGWEPERRLRHQEEGPQAPSSGLHFPGAQAGWGMGWRSPRSSWMPCGRPCRAGAWRSVRWGEHTLELTAVLSLVCPMGPQHTPKIWQGRGLAFSHLFYQDHESACCPAGSVASGYPTRPQDPTHGPAFSPLGAQAGVNERLAAEKRGWRKDMLSAWQQSCKGGPRVPVPWQPPVGAPCLHSGCTSSERNLCCLPADGSLPTSLSGPLSCSLLEGWGSGLELHLLGPWFSRWEMGPWGWRWLNVLTP